MKECGSASKDDLQTWLRGRRCARCWYNRTDRKWNAVEAYSRRLNNGLWQWPTETWRCKKGRIIASGTLSSFGVTTHDSCRSSRYCDIKSCRTSARAVMLKELGVGSVAFAEHQYHHLDRTTKKWMDYCGDLRQQMINRIDALCVEEDVNIQRNSNTQNPLLFAMLSTGD